MSEINNDSKNFVSYEYKEIIASTAMEGFYADGYPSFGWKLDSISQSPIGISMVSIRFKRDRKIRNKAELSRLQRQFENSAAEIEGLERSKFNMASSSALFIGLAGISITVGLVSLVAHASKPNALLFALLSVPALICLALPYFIFKWVQAKRGMDVMPLIEKKYDEIYEICEKAHALSEI